MRTIVTMEWRGLSVCLSVGVFEPCKNGWTDRYAVWVGDLDGIIWCNLANTIEPSMCGGDAAFLSNYFDHLATKISFQNPIQQAALQQY